MITRRFFSVCGWSLTVLLAAAGGVRAQAPDSPPLQLTSEQSGTRPNNVYGPKLIWQTINGQRVLVMYFGGWYRTDPTRPPNDAIYRAVCSAPNQCGDAQKVIDPVAAGMGSAALINNPTIVELPGAGRPYLVMYMTGVTGEDPNAGWTPENNKIYFSTSWADDGVNWSTPQLLIDNAWLPSATIDAGGNVILYANTNWNNNPYFMARYDLGPGGTNVPPPQPFVTDNGVDYINVEARYRPEIGLYQMLAQQTTSGFNSQVDLLQSQDGINWQVAAQGITPDGMTPGAHPDSACWVYYGRAPQIYLSNIFLKAWC
ncbi:MAG TPA: sialidase family protein [Rhodopila sp.]|nr:sialidase family protein [Rhodopila sp.]